MTNNPTIGGVSRATIERIADRLSKAQMFRESTELRAMLDAGISASVERCTSCDDSGDLIDLTGEWRGYCVCPIGEELKNRPTVTPEVAALQSTIARLEARITQLESEKEFSAATYQAARDRIAELESGRGEAFMYGIMRPDGKPHYSELCVSGEASDLEGEAESWTEDGDGVYRVVPLFTAPPAPVAVVLPELESAFEKWWEEDGQYCRAGGGSYEKTFAYRAYEACLDATATLNNKPSTEVKS